MPAAWGQQGHRLLASPLPTPKSQPCPARTRCSRSAFLKPSRAVDFYLFIFYFLIYYYFPRRGEAGEEATPFLVCSSPLSFTRLLSASSQWRVRAWEQQAWGSVIDGQTGRRGARTRTPQRSAPHRGAPAQHRRRRPKGAGPAGRAVGWPRPHGCPGWPRLGVVAVVLGRRGGSAVAGGSL